MEKKILLALILVLVIASCSAALASPAESDIKQAQVLIKKKKFNAALSRLDSIIQNNPSIAQAYADRAGAYLIALRFEAFARTLVPSNATSLISTKSSLIAIDKTCWNKSQSSFKCRFLKVAIVRWSG